MVGPAGSPSLCTRTASAKAQYDRTSIMKASTLVGIVFCSALLAGCVTTSSSMKSFRIAGGQTVQLPVTPSGALPTENADVKIEVTGYMLNGAAHTITYAFGFTEKKGERPREVKVEDVTGDQAQTLVIDRDPQLSPANYWKGNAAPMTRGDPALGWVNQPGNTTKVFRFTITTADGRQLVMYQASIWPGLAKGMVRMVLGQ